MKIFQLDAVAATSAGVAANVRRWHWPVFAA